MTRSSSPPRSTPRRIWPNSRETLTKNLAGFSDSVQKKIVHDNVARLYGLN